MILPQKDEQLSAGFCTSYTGQLYSMKHGREQMSDWTKTPTETGAYWFQIPGCNPDIVWIHDGKVFGVLKTTFDNSVEYGARMGGLYWGPIERPPA